MLVSIGTFNLNNLFSRFNFQAAIGGIPQSSGGFSVEFDDERNVQVRTFMGRLVKGKDLAETQAIAKRIQAMNVDVLAVQEVEHIEILKSFNKDFLNGLYPHVALVEGNDSRMIDIGVLSKLPFGAITSFQAAVHPEEPERRVFSRDLLRVEILNANRGKKLFTLYNTHLKSHFVPFGENQENGALQADHRRRLQAETVSRLIAEMERPNGSFVLTGDMNDPPDSEFLQPMLMVEGQALFNALQDPAETRPAKAEREGPGPQTKAWTYRRNPTGPEPPSYELMDQIWLSPALKDRFVAAHIDRRTKHGGDGSDHDPAWIELNF